MPARLSIEKVDGGFLLETMDENFNIKRSIATKENVLKKAGGIIDARNEKEKKETLLPSKPLNIGDGL
jgi:hypothetical protein